MNTLKSIIVVLCISGLVTACASNPMNAPCDEQAHFCGTKTPINHWEG
jgi:hypothetical protein